MKNFLKALALICFGGALLVGIMVGVEHVKENDGKEESKETLSFEIKHPATSDPFVIEFEEGMTWAEWVDSEYNTYGFYCTQAYDVGIGVAFDYGENGGETFISSDVAPILSTDVIDVEIDYTFA